MVSYQRWENGRVCKNRLDKSMVYQKNSENVWHQQSRTKSFWFVFAIHITAHHVTHLSVFRFRFSRFAFCVAFVFAQDHSFARVVLLDRRCLFG